MCFFPGKTKKYFCVYEILLVYILKNIFSDHEPNTCPIVKELDDLVDDEKFISKAVTKICSAFEYIQMFPADSKTWLIEEASKGVSGM